MNHRLAAFLLYRIAIILAVCLFFLSTTPQARAANWTVRAQPSRLVNGSPVLFQVKTPARVESLSGSWLGHEVQFLEYIPHLQAHFVHPAEVEGGVYKTPQEPGASSDLFQLSVSHT